VSRDASYYEALMMKAVDGLLSAAEQRELDAHLAAHPELAAELADFHDIKGVTDAMTRRLAADAAIEPPRMRPGSRAIVNLAFGLMLLGTLLLIGCGAYLMSIDSAVPLAIKVGAGLTAAGTLLLLGYVLRIRARAAGRDPYEEVDR
jgi:anti-sigma factor RsiW